MKILFSSSGLTCTDHLPLGEGLISFHLAKALADLGHEVTLWSPQVRVQEDHPRLTAVEVGGYPFYPAPGELRYDWYEWRSARAAAARFRAERNRFDIVHHAMPFDVTRGYSLLEPAPAVIGPLFAPWELGEDEYGEKPPAPTGWLAGRIHWRLIHRYQRYAEGQCRRTYAQVRRILVTQERVKKHIPPEYHPKVAVFPVGVDAVRFTPPTAPVAKPVILFLAYLVRRKGLDFLLAAMPKIWARVPEAVLQVVGSGPDEGIFRAQAARLEHRGRIEFIGAAEHRNTVGHFQAAAVYVLPSLGEPFGMSLLEAMACGLPVVAFDFGSPPGIVSPENRPFLVRPRAVDELADRLAVLLDDPGTRRTIGAANRREIEARYTWPVLARELLVQYRAADQLPQG